MFKVNKFIVALVSCFSLFFLWSTFELVYRGWADLPGDATWYFESSFNNGWEDNFYPLYPQFIHFIGRNNAYLTRVIQIIIIVIFSTLLFKYVKSKAWVGSVKLLFYLFYTLNFGLYLLGIQLVRDWVIFILFALSFIIIELFEKKKKWIFVLLYVLVLLTISKLSNIIHYLSLSILLSYFLFSLAKEKKIFSLVLSLLPILIVIILLQRHGYFEFLIHGYKYVVNEGGLQDPTHTNSNFIVSFLNFLFGPGLLRPLNPQKYYDVYTYYFSILTWLACVAWYVFVSLAISIITLKYKSILPSRTFYLYLIGSIAYISIYVTAFGGPGGLRKRMVAYYLLIYAFCELISKVDFVFNKEIALRTIIIFLVLSISATIISA